MPAHSVFSWGRGLAVGALVLTQAYAADFELIGQDTYLSPELTQSFIPPKLAGKSDVLFWTNYLTAGSEDSYQYRNVHDSSGDTFAQLTSVLYYRRLQLETSYARREFAGHPATRIGALLPLDRYKAGVGYYFPIDPALAQRGYDADLRLFAGWTGDRRLDGRFVNEFFVDLTARVPEFLASSWRGFSELQGGYMYAWNREEQQHFLGYDLRCNIYRGRHGSTLRLGGNIGTTEKDGRWRWGAAQFQLAYTSRQILPDLSLETGLGYTRDLARDRWHPQFVIQMNWDAFSQLTSIKR